MALFEPFFVPPFENFLRLFICVDFPTVLACCWNTHTDYFIRYLIEGLTHIHTAAIFGRFWDSIFPLTKSLTPSTRRLLRVGPRSFVSAFFPLLYWKKIPADFRWILCTSRIFSIYMYVGTIHTRIYRNIDTAFVLSLVHSNALPIRLF